MTNVQTNISISNECVRLKSIFAVKSWIRNKNRDKNVASSVNRYYILPYMEVVYPKVDLRIV